MSKVVPSIVFSFFLLFQTAVMAEEDSPMQANIEEQETQEVEAPEETEAAEHEAQAEASQKKIETTEPKEALSEAQKEALAAEEAELREAGMYEESIEE